MQCMQLKFSKLKWDIISIEDNTNQILAKLEDDIQVMKQGISTNVKEEITALKPSLVDGIKTEVQKTLQNESP